MLMMALRYVAKSMRSKRCFNASCIACQRGLTGTSSADQALRLQAKDAMIMYAQLLSSVSSGAVSAWTPFLCCSIVFSWLQRWLAE